MVPVCFSVHECIRRKVRSTLKRLNVAHGSLCPPVSGEATFSLFVRHEHHNDVRSLHAACFKAVSRKYGLPSLHIRRVGFCQPRLVSQNSTKMVNNPN